MWVFYWVLMWFLSWKDCQNIIWFDKIIIKIWVTKNLLGCCNECITVSIWRLTWKQLLWKLGENTDLRQHHVYLKSKLRTVYVSRFGFSVCTADVLLLEEDFVLVGSKGVWDAVLIKCKAIYSNLHRECSQFAFPVMGSVFVNTPEGWA